MQDAKRLEDLAKFNSFISSCLHSFACQEGMTVILNFPEWLVPELLA